MGTKPLHPSYMSTKNWSTLGPAATPKSWRDTPVLKSRAGDASGKGGGSTRAKEIQVPFRSGSERLGRKQRVHRPFRRPQGILGGEPFPAGRRIPTGRRLKRRRNVI